MRASLRRRRSRKRFHHECSHHECSYRKRSRHERSYRKRPHREHSHRAPRRHRTRCHGFNGVSNPDLVPSLKGLVGYYLYLPEGRAYVGRLPNVAFSTLTDEALAAVLNYTVFELGAGSAPAGTKRYTAIEVSGYRRQPLTEVALSTYRRRIVETLIDRYRAPDSLRGYQSPP